MNRTKIPWVRNPDGTQGYTWNPITGCLGPNGTPEKPKRCSYCYAHKLANGRLKKRYLASPTDITGEPLIIPDGDPLDPFTPRLWPRRLLEPHTVKKPSTIFICSMGEVFGDFIPVRWIYWILETCRNCPQHTFQILTKNPNRAKEFYFPDNVWLGVTVTSESDWPRVPLLLGSDAKVKFISFEPLLGDVFKDPKLASFSGFSYVDWAIIGARTRPYLKPDPAWVYNIIDRAHSEGIPVFVKDNLRWSEKIEEMPTTVKTLAKKFPESRRSSLMDDFIASVNLEE